METKLFEIRDSGTLIPAVAVRVSGKDGPLARRAGYGNTPCTILTFMIGGRRAEYDPFAWCDRTMTTAHAFIDREWESLPSGSVVCVEYILGERATPKTSEL